MTQIVLENVDPAVVEKLQALAQQHGRTLEAEATAILEQAIAPKPKLTEAEIRERKVALMRKQMEDHARKLGKPIDPPPMGKTITPEEFDQITMRLQALKKQGFSLGGMSIREARDYGRRY